LFVAVFSVKLCNHCIEDTLGLIFCERLSLLSLSAPVVWIMKLGYELLPHLFLLSLMWMTLAPLKAETESPPIGQRNLADEEF